MTKNVVVHFNTKYNLSKKLSSEVSRLHYQKKFAKENFAEAEGNCFQFTRKHLFGAKFAKETFACSTQVIELLKLMDLCQHKLTMVLF